MVLFIWFLLSLVTKNFSNFCCRASPLPTELDILLSMFPLEAPADLLHLLETCGFENAVGINFEMHSHFDLFANAVEVGTTQLQRLLSQVIFYREIAALHFFCF